MGVCCGKPKEPNKPGGHRPIGGHASAAQHSAPQKEQQSKAQPASSEGGNLLGGEKTTSKEDAKAKQLAAAEARAAENQQRGIGNDKKAKELAERGEKDELIGKIKAWYMMKKEEPPMGLNMASVEQLRKTYQSLSSSA